MNQSIKVTIEAFAANDVEKARYTIDRAVKQMKELYPKSTDKDIDLLLGKMNNYALAIHNFIKKGKIELLKKG